jgi:hypothetical protein
MPSRTEADVVFLTDSGFVPDNPIRAGCGWPLLIVVVASWAAVALVVWAAGWLG